MKSVHVEPRLEQLIPPLTDEQFKQLEDNLKEAGGPIQPLWLWGEVLVDGHHRFKICRTHGLPYTTKQVWEDLFDIEQVAARMKKLAIGQRNLTAQQQSKIRAQVSSDLQLSLGAQQAVRDTAKQAGVSERQVYRDRQKAKAAEQFHEDLKDNDEVWKLSPESMSKLSQLHVDEQIDIAERSNYDTREMAGEIKRLESVKGSTLYNAKKAAQKERAKKVALDRNRKGLVVESVEQLTETAKVMRQAHKALQLSQGNWDRAYHHLTELDQILASWKDQA
jgi:hypothetical protein